MPALKEVSIVRWAQELMLLRVIQWLLLPAPSVGANALD
ncbi:hypothetical protein PMIT1303_02653 [Prochlorococcus sp. MIT 1303]|nr:hypothetical protein PMIT1303_02653 [Prochlorococcus sp. MIT 1303]